VNSPHPSLLPEGEGVKSLLKSSFISLWERTEVRGKGVFKQTLKLSDFPLHTVRKI